jgi:hypothetical protein
VFHTHVRFASGCCVLGRALSPSCTSDANFSHFAGSHSQSAAGRSLRHQRTSYRTVTVPGLAARTDRERRFTDRCSSHRLAVKHVCYTCPSVPLLVLQMQRTHSIHRCGKFSRCSHTAANFITLNASCLSFVRCSRKLITSRLFNSSCFCYRMPCSCLP